MISDEFYCPECGELWNGIICDNCGFEDENVGATRQKPKNKDGYDKKVQDRNKDKRKEN